MTRGHPLTCQITVITWGERGLAELGQLEGLTKTPWSPPFRDAHMIRTSCKVSDTSKSNRSAHFNCENPNHQPTLNRFLPQFNYPTTKNLRI